MDKGNAEQSGLNSLSTSGVRDIGESLLHEAASTKSSAVCGKPQCLICSTGNTFDKVSGLALHFKFKHSALFTKLDLPTDGTISSSSSSTYLCAVCNEMKCSKLPSLMNHIYSDHPQHTMRHSEGTATERRADIECNDYKIEALYLPNCHGTTSDILSLSDKPRSKKRHAMESFSMFYVVDTNVESGSKSYCCELCPWSTAEVEAIKKHYRGHAESVLGYRCKICDFCNKKQSFIREHTKDAHEKTQQKNIYYECPFCVYKHPYKASWQQHLSRHTQKKDGKYRCAICKFTCNGERIMRYHRKHSHKDSSSIAVGSSTVNPDPTKTINNSMQGGDSNDIQIVCEILRPSPNAKSGKNHTGECEDLERSNCNKRKCSLRSTKELKSTETNVHDNVDVSHSQLHAKSAKLLISNHVAAATVPQHVDNGTCPKMHLAIGDIGSGSGKSLLPNVAVSEAVGNGSDSNLQPTNVVQDAGNNSCINSLPSATGSQDAGNSSCINSQPNIAAKRSYITRCANVVASLDVSNDSTFISQDDDNAVIAAEGSAMEVSDSGNAEQTRPSQSQDPVTSWLHQIPQERGVDATGDSEVGDDLPTPHAASLESEKISLDSVNNDNSDVRNQQQCKTYPCPYCKVFTNDSKILFLHMLTEHAVEKAGLPRECVYANIKNMLNISPETTQLDNATESGQIQHLEGNTRSATANNNSQFDRRMPIYYQPPHQSRFQQQNNNQSMSVPNVATVYGGGNVMNPNISSRPTHRHQECNRMMSAPQDRTVIGSNDAHSGYNEERSSVQVTQPCYVPSTTQYSNVHSSQSMAPQHNPVRASNITQHLQYNRNVSGGLQGVPEANTTTYGNILQNEQDTATPVLHHPTLSVQSMPQNRNSPCDNLHEPLSERATATSVPQVPVKQEYNSSF